MNTSYFTDFIQAKDICKTRIFYALKCSPREGRILQHLATQYLKGQSDIEVADLLETLFKAKEAEALPYLACIKNLLDLEWVVQEKRTRRQEVLLLELFDSSIALSGHFFKLVQEGHNKHPFLEITLYSDHLDYFNDWFLKIEILQKLQKVGLRGRAKLQADLQLLEHKIKARTKSTQTPLAVQKFLNKHHLNPKETLLFFALLKDAYNARDFVKEDDSLSQHQNLLQLLSADGSNSAESAHLLSPTSPLIKKKIMDYEELLDPFENGLVRQFFLQDMVLETITSPTPPRANTTLKHILKDSDIFEALEPKEGLEAVVLSQKTKETLEILLKQMDPQMQQRLKEWGLENKNHKDIDAKIIFYGPPGTGKTMSALALAKSLKKEVLGFDCSKILSMYVGESEKNVRRIFDDYQKIARQCKNPPILFLDEADQFLSTRTSASSGADKMHNQMQNIFLHQIEKFEGVLIATTNLLETLDAAFSRRFNHKIEFRLPTFEQRVQLWEKYLPKNAPYAPPESAKSLARQLAKHALSGGQIALVVKNTAYKVATYKNPLFSLEDFTSEIAKEKQGNFDGAKNIGFGVGL
ncbi:ATP-binding protein [Helicobacter ailurogastricus]|uniref:ATP-binding protein n=1 Tax=Helicobacter ailurogastricus TaxID=1578720 RepID=UPI00244D7DEB|nr:ATP-binding protein [Helicobacter ailurogastricus]GMB91627.1 ATP-binding protein [Helicobacter ailurogastricus]